MLGARTRAFEASESPSPPPAPGPLATTVLRRLSAEVNVRVRLTPPPDVFEGDRLAAAASK